jgi:hypothetical protein
MLDATKIGYLRSSASSTSQPRPASGPTKAMLNKLVKSGHVIVEKGAFRRSETGDESLREFDRRLTGADIAMLRSIARDEKVNAGAAGIRKLLDARLAWIAPNLKNHLTPEAEALLEGL